MTLEQTLHFFEPYFKEKGLWYFWDETWTHRHGPYPTRDAAKEACALYAESL